jgi:hypothetical protein
MGLIYSTPIDGAREGDGRVSSGFLGQYAKWFTMHNLSFMLRNDGGQWLCESVGRHGDLPFMARSERCTTAEEAAYKCYVAAVSKLREEPYIMG